METQNSVFIATSLDGYIARIDGSIDWLDAANVVVPEGEDCGYGAFMASIDALVMGSKSFEKVLSFRSWPYENKIVIVLSRSGIEIPEALKPNVSCSGESPQELCQRLSQEGAKRLYIDGGAVIQSFLVAGLINDLTITVIPVLLGSGIALFGQLDQDIELEHISTKSYEFGFVQSKYLVKPRSDGD